MEGTLPLKWRLRWDFNGGVNGGTIVNETNRPLGPVSDSRPLNTLKKLDIESNVPAYPASNRTEQV
jgi:hypothetical protein